MNTGTKIRTVAAVLTYLVLWIKSMWGVDLSNLFTPEVISSVATLTVTGGAWFASHFFNNDYTAEAAEGTGLTRLRKFMKKAQKAGRDINGENFFDTVSEIRDNLEKKEPTETTSSDEEETAEEAEEDAR